VPSPETQAAWRSDHREASPRRAEVSSRQRGEATGATAGWPAAVRAAARRVRIRRLISSPYRRFFAQRREGREVSFRWSVKVARVCGSAQTMTERPPGGTDCSGKAREKILRGVQWKGPMSCLISS